MQGGPTRLDHIAASAARDGLAFRGAFHAREDDDVPDPADGRPAGTLVLLGFAGRDGWPSFTRSPEACDGIDHPLDRWSRRVISRLAGDVGAATAFPFDGPPWLPFGRWAVRSGEVTASPLGILIHPRWGLWHSYRGALVFTEKLELPKPAEPSDPCATCKDRPCLQACPVSAFSADRYDVTRCREHLATPGGAGCVTGGCLARRACPVGAAHAYEADQMRFLMRAFRRG